MSMQLHAVAVGKEGIAGGHIQPCSQGGSCDSYNLFPQNGNFNNGAFRKHEREISEALTNGQQVGQVKMKFERSNPNNVRPDQVIVEYEIDGKIYIEPFENIAGGGR
jgi:hypothetical protein